MTDKEQIIIDGVDVKNCRRRIGKNNYCRYFKRLCSENNFNCVWKQLYRKTQECKELKDYARRQENQREEYYKEYLKLSQKCKELEEEIKGLKDYIKWIMRLQ